MGKNTDPAISAWYKKIAKQRKNMYHAFSDKGVAREAALKSWENRRAKKANAETDAITDTEAEPKA